MADEFNQDGALDEEMNVEEAHDPKNAEKQSIAATSAAEKKGPTAPQLKGSKKNSEPMPKSKAGKISAAHDLMSEMSGAQLDAVLQTLMGNEVEADAVAEARHVPLNVDFTDDLNALVESEATLSEEFKAKTAIIFEAAVKSKLSEEIDRLEEAYATELQEEVATQKAELVEKVDSYLNYVVEQWMEDNALAIQSGLRAEIAEDFMKGLKNLFTESYVDVPEAKVDLVDELSQQVEEMAEKLNGSTEAILEMAAELETFKREAVIREASEGLAATQVAKLRTMVEGFDFDDEFAHKVAVVKESVFSAKKATASEEIVEDEALNEEVSGTMASYLSAIKTLNN